jgi:hypothetical protein
VPDHDDNPKTGRPTHPAEATLAAYLDGELSVAERTDVEAHLAECASCRAALADTVAILDGADSHVENRRAATPVPPTRRRAPWPLVGLALAASVAGIVILRPSVPSTDVDSRTRDQRVGAADERIRQLAAIAPADGATQLAAHPTFVWASDSVDRYRFALLAEDGATIWSRELSDTALAIPADVTLDHGRSYFWRVDAMSAGIVASTRVRRFTVAP